MKKKERERVYAAVAKIADILNELEANGIVVTMESDMWFGTSHETFDDIALLDHSSDLEGWGCTGT